MLKAGDFKVCLSSIEFSIFYQESTPKCCPSCGQFFPPETLSEVASRYFRESYFRLSSLILVLGVGSWLCYKMIIKKKSKMKPKKSMPSSCSTITPHDQMIIKFRSNSPHSSSKKSTAAAAAAAAAAAVYSNLNHRFHHSKETLTHDSHGLPTEEVSYTVSYSDSETDYVDLEDEEDEVYTKEMDALSKALDQYSTTKRTYSISSQSGEIGEGTIAKLDQLLHQIEDIKESVGKMNSDFFTVHSYDHNRLLTAADINDEDGDGHLSNYFGNSGQDSHVLRPLEYLGDKEEPQTPSLEWDSNDINLFSEVNQGYQSSETEIRKTSLNALVKVSAKKQIATSLSSTNQNKSSSSTVSIENSNNDASSFKPFGPDLVSPVISESINSFPTSSSYRNLANLDTSFTTSGIISSSGVTSIDGSLLSSPDQERIRFESIHDLIKEARRLGLLNDLVKFLLKNANRDSAYFED